MKIEFANNILVGLFQQQFVSCDRDVIVFVMDVIVLRHWLCILLISPERKNKNFQHKEKQ